MTKRELLNALASFGDDQCVFVCLLSEHYPYGCQVIIQGVASVPPWHGGQPDGSADLIGLVCHDQNAILKPQAVKARRYEPAPVVSRWVIDDGGGVVVPAHLVPELEATITKGEGRCAAP